MNDEDPKKKIINLFNDTNAKPEETGGIHINIPGNNNVVNFGDHNSMNPKPATPATKIVIEAGGQHISSKEAAELQRLVSQIHDTEQILKRNPSSFGKIWKALNSHCEVPRYREIASTDFDKARGYLNQWLGRLNSMRSAPIKNGDDWRKRHYAYIKINAKNKADKAALDAYLMRNFKTTSLRELSNDELEIAYRYVAGRRKR